jgi:hypothetical protein
MTEVATPNDYPFAKTFYQVIDSRFKLPMRWVFEQFKLHGFFTPAEIKRCHPHQTKWTRIAELCQQPPAHGVESLSRIDRFGEMPLPGEHFKAIGF